MKTIITWVPGEKKLLLHIYDGEGKLVERQTYSDTHLLKIVKPIVVPYTLLNNIRVYVVDDTVRVERRNSITIIK